jgi:hypothetical protein
MLAALAVALAATVNACGNRSGTSDGSGASTGSPIPVQTLADALALIRSEEAESADTTRGTSALPVTLNGDDAWMAGPEGGFSVDGGNQTITLTSDGASLEDPRYISFAIFRMSGHAGDAVRRLELNINFTAGNYWVYAVDYSPPCVEIFRAI